jgi:dTDP-L-rhamnose 4-epimerase
MVFMLENPKANLDTYNVCSGAPTSIIEVARVLARLMGHPEIEPQLAGSFRAGDIRHCFGDGSKLEALGWKPSISLDEGFAELVRWSESEEAVDKVADAHRELVEKGLVR